MKTAAPASSAALGEFTLRGIIIGFVICVLFTAANVYFGLKAGITFSTSIPAAVISMAILRSLRGATMQENNIVQTVASAAGSYLLFERPILRLKNRLAWFDRAATSLRLALGGLRTAES